jgi:hypothetical protein
LAEAEADDLVRLPASTVPGAPAALSLPEQRLARRWGGRHPFLLQLAADALWQARQEGRDEAWTYTRFVEQARHVPHPRWRHWLRSVFWQGPAALGRLAGRLGGGVDEFRNWLIGMVIIVVIVLALFGIVSGGQLLELLRKWLGV